MKGEEQTEQGSRRQGEVETRSEAKDKGGKEKRTVFVDRARASWGTFHVLIILKTSQGEFLALAVHEEEPNY